MDELTFPKWAYDLAALSSIMGLLLSCLLLYNVHKISASYLLRARIPEAIQGLTEIAKDLSAELPNWPAASPEVLVQFGKAKAVISNIAPRLSGPAKNSGKALVKKIEGSAKALDQPSNNAGRTKFLWLLYADLEEFIETLVQLEKDSRWGKN